MSRKLAAPPPVEGPAAIIVLGCAVRLDERGLLVPSALFRRIDAASRTFHVRGSPSTFVIACGGRRWDRAVEADVMARELETRGVPPSAIVRERCSFSTRENVRFAAAILGRRGIDAASVVTCGWHMRRALALFAHCGVRVEPIAATERWVPWHLRVWRAAREEALFLAEVRSRGGPAPRRS